MPIDRHTFEITSEDALEELSISDSLLGFLAANENRAFRAAKSPPRSASKRGQSVLYSLG
jgi:hypothetical protein